MALPPLPNPTPENTVRLKPIPQWLDPNWPIDQVPTEPDHLGRFWTIEGWVLVLKDRLDRSDTHFNGPYIRRCLAAIKYLESEIERRRIARMTRGPRPKTDQPDGSGLFGTTTTIE